MPPRDVDFSAENDGAHLARREVLDRLAAHELPRFLMRQRWYAAKHGASPTVTVRWQQAWTHSPGCLLIVTATPPDEPSQDYFLPLRALSDGPPADPASLLAEIHWRDGPLWLVEAFADDDFVHSWAAALTGSPEAPLPGPLEGSRPDGLPPDLKGAAIARPKAEQSNTSIRIGDMLIKVLRKIEDGIHPESEIGAFLCGRFANTPRYLGAIALKDGPTTLSLAQHWLPNDGDGWSDVLRRLKAAIAAKASPLADDAMLGLARRLGQRTAEMHRAFATGQEPAFRLEAASPGDLREWTGDVIGMAEATFDQLQAALPRLAQPLRPSAERLLSRRRSMPSAIDALPPRDARLVRSRLHGDYHLGQVLVAADDVFVVDFEGEPMRPLQERRAKHCVLRDVAGMLRSFAYAAASAPGGDPADLAVWRRSMSQTFLDAYRQTIGDCPSHPRDTKEADRLLRLFLLEKAFYELRYELANRPDWVAIPLAGLAELLHDPGHDMPFGAQCLSEGGVRFRLWAPAQPAVELVLAAEGAVLPMTALEGGWHELRTDRCRPGTRYRFRLADGRQVPDPASRYQPEDVPGPSQVIDPGEFIWTDGTWKGRPWHETVLYELHVGSFTAEGGFRAVIDHLDDLKSLGVTAVELMPVADFPGNRNWGYDGVLPYAPDSSYGRPEDLKVLIDAAHAKGLMVFLDVVYNHFGPSGNYLSAYAPQCFTDRHQTPWGDGLNYDGPEAATFRSFIIHNALYWIEEYHLDGLRLDAVHAIADDSPHHILEELAESVHAMVAGRRHVHLILENDANRSRLLARDPSGRPRWYVAQWNDDLHHCLHAIMTGETGGYYADFTGGIPQLGRALAEGFVYQGEPSPYRDGEIRGEPSGHLPPLAFVSFIQNHDQVGNRAFGERLGQLVSEERLRAAAAIYLLAPQIPMLFMGEEWAASQPFPFFCDFEPDLAEAVRKGRRAEFAKFPEFQDPARRDRIPDPTAIETFLSAKLDWGARQSPRHLAWIDTYRRLLAVRTAEITPRLAAIGAGQANYSSTPEGGLAVTWRLADGSSLLLAANLSDQPRPGLAAPIGRPLWTHGQPGDPWWVAVALTTSPKA